MQEKPKSFRLKLTYTLANCEAMLLGSEPPRGQARTGWRPRDIVHGVHGVHIVHGDTDASCSFTIDLLLLGGPIDSAYFSHLLLHISAPNPGYNCQTTPWIIVILKLLCKAL